MSIISLQKLLREFDKGSKYFPFVDNSDDIFSWLTFFLDCDNLINWAFCEFARLPLP